MKPLERADILGKAEYEAARVDFRRRIMARKARRRLELGDSVSVHFEDHETMRYQIQEMLRAEDSWERPGAVEAELEAYNPLIPRAGELSATIMFEYPTPGERDRRLRELVGIERHLWLAIGDAEPVAAVFDERQISRERISSVQYVKWLLSDRQRALLKADGTVVRIVIDHPALRAQAVLGEATRREIMSDPD
ncbi:MAG: DUF3501 family protein [Acidobacteria bacterium]|nr:DUF3501 family protein [Acidobacteriota bacterium]